MRRKIVIEDLVASLIAIAFYIGLILVIVGLCLASWGLIGGGLATAGMTLTILAVVRVMSDLREIAEERTFGWSVMIGCRVVAEAMVSIFMYMTVMQLLLLFGNLVGVIGRSLKGR